MTEWPVFNTLVFSKNGSVLVMHSENDDPNCFTGEHVTTGELSCMWDKSKFFSNPRYDKEFYTIGAIYRMLTRGKINKEQAINLMENRGKVKTGTAKGTVEMWLANPKKHFNDAPRGEDEPV